MSFSESDCLLLENLTNGISVLSTGKAEMLKEACIWCLTQCQHENGVTFECLFCKNDTCFSVKWEDDVDIHRINRAYNLDDAVEFGAEAVSLLLVKEKTELTLISVF